MAISFNEDTKSIHWNFHSIEEMVGTIEKIEIYYIPNVRTRDMEYTLVLKLCIDGQKFACAHLEHNEKIIGINFFNLFQLASIDHPFLTKQSSINLDDYIGHTFPVYKIINECKTFKDGGYFTKSLHKIADIPSQEWSNLK